MAFINLKLSAHFTAECRGALTHYGSFNNYVDKKRGEGVRTKFTLSHMTKGRYDIKCQQLYT